ncbi:enoyl-CoA hydratase [Actinophytocola gossypii]|uniref:Enoyl-CoA hydratase n=1 Tax=Actinophytocola gossypii TaxID=2812003 RepID=A0ABT2J6P6_9PSEU|nr:enoyl-CoA hydratase [Actinophytocola gossypii]MCT2583530.1 enoyl-CoA hydratase [Actinophytocola gossypii]
MTADPVLVDVDGPVATITLNRPEARNAINPALLAALAEAMAEADAAENVHAVVLTGADPAFCAGLDLRELTGLHDAVTSATGSPWPPIGKPVVAAVNGPAVTGGLELVLNCDVVICSDRARFADTHARVGVLPGWGLTVLLPLAVGRARARQMSLTGDFVPADQALAAGLVSEVVPHDDLLARAGTIAATIAGNNQRAVRALLASYREVEAELVAGGYDAEARAARSWAATDLDLAESTRRRSAVVDRGRRQT